jgi:hypothetical protein
MKNWIVFLEINTGFDEAFKAAADLGLKILYISATPIKVPVRNIERAC